GGPLRLSEPALSTQRPAERAAGGAGHQDLDRGVLAHGRGASPAFRLSHPRDPPRAPLGPPAPPALPPLPAPPGGCEMKIGISCYPTYGGSGIVATELAMALAEQGDEVHVISYALPQRLAFLTPTLFFHEVIVPRYPLFEYPPYPLALATKM